MPDGFSVEIEDSVTAALLRLGDAAQPYVDGAAKVTADIIDHEASGRLRRSLGPAATGLTEAGIVVTKADRGGYLVSATRNPFPMLPLWIEKGTKKGKRKGHSGGGMTARPFFYISAELEEGAHLRRVEEALQDAIDAQGLGE